MTKDEALQMCLEYIETDAHERRHVRWAIKEALAQRTWQGLTDEEIHSCLKGLPTQSIGVYARSVEAKLKEKNT